MAFRNLYDFDRKFLANTIFGTQEKRALRRLDAWMDGQVKMPVDILYQIKVLLPTLDLEASLKSLYEHYELHDCKTRARARAGTKEHHDHDP